MTVTTAPPRVLDAMVPHSAGDLLAASEIIGVGEVLFGLVSDWEAWMERRVENVAFQDADTVRRRVSVDFILPAVPTPFRRPATDAGPTHMVPLGLLFKRRLVNFDLRDESGVALALMSKRHNGVIAAAVLVAAARAWVEPQSGRADLPPLVVEDLWTIATSTQPVANTAFMSLGRPRSRSRGETSWRCRLVASEDFMTLARDLAGAFLVLTPLHDSVGHRRILKFAYDEPGQLPQTRVPLRRRAGEVVSRATQEGPVLRGSGRLVRGGRSSGPNCMARVIALLRDAPEEAPFYRALPDLRLTFTSEHNTYEAVTGETGEALFQAHEGSYAIAVDNPPEGRILVGLVPTPWELHASSESVVVRLEYWPAPLVGFDADKLPDLTWPRRIMRAAALVPKTIKIDAPAIGQSRSYHLEFEVADGLQAIRAYLAAEETYTRGATDLHGARPSSTARTAPTDVVTKQSVGISQRVHVHSERAHQGHTGSVIISLLPRSHKVVRSGVFAAALSSLALTIALMRWSSLSAAPGPAIAMLLLVPGIVAAYVARTLEHAFTTEVLVGLRMLALMTGLLPFLGGALLIASREVHVESSGAVVLGEPWWGTPWVLGILLAADLVCLGLFVAAHRRCGRA